MSLEVPLYKFRVNRIFEYDHDEMLAARKLARVWQAPLRSGLQLTLALEIPPQNPAPNARRVPVVPGGTGPTIVQLRDELQKGIDWFSQVWTAVCVSDGPGPETCLVLKIIQPSMCRGPPEHPFDEYYEPWDLAHNEAWVYRHLAHQQGLLIPYFFGLSTIVTPCGEEAWVLVLEFIPGLTISSFTDPASIPNIRDFVSTSVIVILPSLLLDRLMERVLAFSTEVGSRQLVFAALSSHHPQEEKETELNLSMRGGYISGSRVQEVSDFVLSTEGGKAGDLIWEDTLGILGKVDARVDGIVGKYLKS